MLVLRELLVFLSFVHTQLMKRKIRGGGFNLFKIVKLIHLKKYAI